MYIFLEANADISIYHYRVPSTLLLTNV